MADTKPKRRLKNVVVDEITICDKGMVPDADFVRLSKRVDVQPETEPEVPDTPAVSELVALAKAMDEEQSYEASNVLRLMAEMTQLGAALKRCKKKLSPELQKAFDDLKTAMHDDKVEKSDETEPVAKTPEPEVPAEAPAEPVKKKTASDEFAEAMKLIKQHRQAEADQEDELLVKSAIDSLGSLSAVLKQTQEELTVLKSDLAHAKGQE